VSNVIERDRRNGAGATTWYFPDGDRPPTNGGPIEAHESLMILNVSDRTANVEIDLFWVDKEPTLAIEVEVPAERVRCLRVPWFDRPADAERVDVPTRTQYAMRIRSDIPVVCQYGRLEVVPSYALYTTIGFVDPRDIVERGAEHVA
jgi:hypothetical protein